MKNTIIIIIAIFSIFLTSCEKQFISTVNVPNVQPKLVVNSYISPQVENILVYVQYSIAINSFQNNDILTDAIVTISDDKKTVTLPYNNLYRAYAVLQSDTFKIVEGKTYFLNVSHKDKSVSAQCTVPSGDIPKVTIVDTNFIFSNNETYIKTKFVDRENSNDCYHIACYGINDLDSINPSYSQLIAASNGYYCDKFSENEIYDYFQKNTYVLTKDYVIVLALTDEHYYYYSTSVLNFEGDNPFSEPSTIYSNIKGGLGVFAAYTSKKYYFKIGK